MSDYSFPSLSAGEALQFQDRGALVLDVRKAPALRASGQAVRGARWRDPLTFDRSDPALAETRPVVVYCVHGHEVSHYAAALLRVHGVEAFVVRGGFEALVAAGAPLEAVSHED